MEKKRERERKGKIMAQGGKGTSPNHNSRARASFKLREFSGEGTREGWRFILTCVLYALYNENRRKRKRAVSVVCVSVSCVYYLYVQRLHTLDAFNWRVSEPVRTRRAGQM